MNTVHARFIPTDGTDLGPGSRIEIDGVEHPIPDRTDLGDTAPLRILQAIKDAGYVPIDGYYKSLTNNGILLRTLDIS